MAETRMEGNLPRVRTSQEGEPNIDAFSGVVSSYWEAKKPAHTVNSPEMP